MQKMLDANDLKEMFGIALRSVYELMKQPDFPVIRVSARRYVVPEDALNKWVDCQVVKSKEMKNNAFK